ncbi:hypothetical protein NWE55_09410 [Myroides albus]|nr:hypothetical protein [Myroides albus]UVD78352.1 hypothetical protein NWE55_09410 [Myroides albus]
MDSKVSRDEVGLLSDCRAMAFLVGNDLELRAMPFRIEFLYT